MQTFVKWLLTSIRGLVYMRALSLTDALVHWLAHVCFRLVSKRATNVLYSTQSLDSFASYHESCWFRHRNKGTLPLSTSSTSWRQIHLILFKTDIILRYPIWISLIQLLVGTGTRQHYHCLLHARGEAGQGQHKTIKKTLFCQSLYWYERINHKSRKKYLEIPS